MKRSFFLTLLSSGFVALSLQAAELRSTLGTVEVQRSGSNVWTQGRPKTEVKSGDVVRTGRGSETEIRMKEGHKMVLREKTTLKLDSVQGGETRLNLVVGRMRSFVSKLKGQNKFEVKTPAAVASIRGTVFEIEVGEDQKSRLSVLEGIVSFRDLAGIGQEVQVLKGQSVVIESGMAPHPAEPLPADMQQGLVPEQGGGRTAMAAQGLKAEVQREAGLAAFKEFFQADAANEMKTAQYQEEKTVIDAFGARVRLEQYIARPAANQWSYVALNTREDRSDFTRFDIYAHSALPDDMSSINLFSGTGSMSNWAEKTHRLSSNGNDYYREWQAGGSPVSLSNGKTQVIFSDWFTEVKGDAAPTLLSHWVPSAAYLGGNADATKTRDQADVAADFAQDLPSGYVDYEGTDAGTTVGDSRSIDSAGYTNAERLNYFGNAAVASSYAGSEGYARTSQTLFDDRTFGASTLSQLLNSTKISRSSIYDVPSTVTDITLKVDQYTITDEGTPLTLVQAGSLGADLQGVNSESVFNSSLTGNRKIDIVISPSIFKKAGLLDN